MFWGATFFDVSKTLYSVPPHRTYSKSAKAAKSWPDVLGGLGNAGLHMVGWNRGAGKLRTKSGNGKKGAFESGESDVGGKF